VVRAALELWHAETEMRTRNRPNTSPRRLAFIVLTAAGAATPIALFAGCYDDPVIFRGSIGASCRVTNDCQPPHECIANVCGGPSDGGGSGGGGGSDAGTIEGGPSAEAGPWNPCDGCLDMKCAAENAACDSECVGIEACLEEICANLSAIGSPDEGKCQTTCQSQYPGGKDTHIAVVDCAIKATCRPPCQGYPKDYNGCRSFMNNGDCAGALAACEASAECLTYRSCVSTCTTLAGCLDCANTVEGAAGKKILRAYEVCVASECTAESWLLDEAFP
jgi:hypothetical protein